MAESAAKQSPEGKLPRIQAQNALGCGFRMFMKPAKPQVPVDMSSLRDNVFTFPPLDVTPWLFQFNQINVSLFLQQQLPDMPFDQASLKSGWSQSGSKQETRQHGLPINDTGYYPETQNTDNSLSLTVR